jgi:hypothetical protein
MSDEEIRLKCLELAINNYGLGEGGYQEAQRIYQFLHNQKNGYDYLPRGVPYQKIVVFNN